MFKLLFPIILLLAFLNANAQSTSDVNTVYNHVDIMPQFPCGDEAFFQYLSKNIKYPKKARRKNIQGTVYVSFVVDGDGKIFDIFVIKGVNKELDNEAIRLVSAMPDWIPGIQNNKYVKVQCNLPLKFSLR